MISGSLGEVLGCCEESSGSGSGSGSSSGSGSGSSSSCVCDWTAGNTSIVDADNGSFDVVNNGSCDITVTYYDGGGIISPPLPHVVSAGTTVTFTVTDAGGSYADFYIGTAECGDYGLIAWPG